MKWSFTLLLTIAAAWIAHELAEKPEAKHLALQAPWSGTGAPEYSGREVEKAPPLPGFEELLAMPARERLRLLILALPEMPLGDVESLYERLVQFQGESQVGIAAAGDLVLDRWLELAPERAVAFVRKHYSRIRYWHHVPSPEQVMFRLADRDIATALEIPYEKHRISAGKLTHHHFRDLAARDPQAAIRQLGKVGEENVSSARAGIMVGWVTHDPEAAIAWADNIPEPATRKDVLAALLNALTKQDNFALAKATAEDLGEVDWQRARTFVSAWVKESPLEAGAWLGPQLEDVRAFQDLPNEHLWTSGSSQVEGENARFFLAVLAASDLGAGNPSSGVPLPLGKLLKHVARENPAEARDWLLKMPTGLVSPKVVEGLVEGWSALDPEEALSFAGRMPEHYQEENDRWRSFRAGLQRTAMVEFSKQSPQAAADYLESEDLVEAFGGSVAKQWAEQDHNAALDWILSKPPETSNALIHASLGSILEKDLQAGLDLMATLNEDQQERHRSHAMNVWIQEDPATAADWMSDFEVDERYRQNFGNLVREWSEKDIDVVGRYVSAMMPSLNRDSACTALVHALQLGGERFEDAYAWASEISDGESRVHAVESVLTSWAHHDPRAVEAIRAQEEVKP